MSKKATKQVDLPPKDRFGPIYLAFRANTPEALMQDVTLLIKNKNQLLDEAQREFLFQVFWENRQLEYAKFLFLYKIIMLGLGLDISKQQLVQMVISKISVLTKVNAGYEYDLNSYSSDADDVNYVSQIDGHEKLILKDVLFANDCMVQINNIGKVDDVPAKDAKKQVKKYGFQLTMEEAQQILNQFLRIARSLTLYRTVFDESFVQRQIISSEVVSAVHLPMVKQLEPLQAGVIFKEKTELEMKVLSVLKPMAHQLHMDIIAQNAENSKK